MPRNRNQTHPATIRAKQRAAEAVKLRIAGATFDQIAEKLGYNSKQAAFGAVTGALRQTQREPADELRSVDSERLDLLWQRTFSQAMSGDLAALQACLKILDRRAKLLGLDAPIKTENKTDLLSKRTLSDFTTAELAALENVLNAVPDKAVS